MRVSWMSTNRCNLKCAHCYQDAGDATAKELSTEEAHALIDGIARAGFKVMIFSGGEPLMREDIFDLVSYARDAGLAPVFGTNATLITPDIAKRLKAAGARAMGISLDSLDPAEHDAFRGVEGAYAATLAGLTYCVVGSEGIVRPCAYMTCEAGDVRRTPFDEIWENAEVFKRLRTRTYSGACGTCDYREGCGGCRARAGYYHEGDIMAQDDYCAWGMGLLKEKTEDQGGLV